MTEFICGTGMFRAQPVTIGRLEHHIQKKRWNKLRHAVENMPAWAGAGGSAFKQPFDSREIARSHESQMVVIWPHNPHAYTAAKAISSLRELGITLSALDIGIKLVFDGSHEEAYNKEMAAKAAKDMEAAFSPGVYEHYKGNLFIANKLIPDSTNDSNGALYVEYWSHASGPDGSHIRKLVEWSGHVEWPDHVFRPRFRRLVER